MLTPCKVSAPINEEKREKTSVQCLPKKKEEWKVAHTTFTIINKKKRKEML